MHHKWPLRTSHNSQVLSTSPKDSTLAAKSANSIGEVLLCMVNVIMLFPETLPIASTCDGLLFLYSSRLADGLVGNVVH